MMADAPTRYRSMLGEAPAGSCVVVGGLAWLRCETSVEVREGVPPVCAPEEAPEDLRIREREEERQRAAAREAAELARQEAEEEQEAADVEAYATPPDGAEASWDALAQRIATMELEAADDLAAALHGLRADAGALADRVPGKGWVEGLQGRLDRIEATLAALAAAWEVTT